MSYYPFYLDLEKKNCLIVGGGRVAYRKAVTFLECGACVKVVAPEIIEEIHLLQDETGCILLVNREFCTRDIEDMFLVVATTNDRELNQRIVDLCEQKKILVNDASVKNEKGIHFGSTIRRGPILIGISTMGKSPMLNTNIKKIMDEALPDYYSEVAKIMEKYRVAIQNRTSDQKVRNECYRQLMNLAINKKGNLCSDEVEKLMLKQIGGQVDGEN